MKVFWTLEVRSTAGYRQGMAETRRRRRVRRPGSPAPESGRAAGPLAETAPVHDPEPEADGRTPGDDRDAERGLRGLIGAGSSQVSTAAAMRARDAARPSDDDLATAEADLVVVRRGWVPRDPFTR